MKLRYITFFIVLAGAVIYVPGLIKKDLPAKEEVLQYIQSVKKIKKLMKNNKAGSDDTDEYLIDSDMDKYLDSKRKEIGLDDLKSYEMHAPVMKKLMSLSSKKNVNITSLVNTIYMQYLNFIELHVSYGNYYVLFGVLIIILSMFFSKAGLIPLLSLLGRLGFFLCRFQMLTFSIIAVLFWFLLKRNLWLDAGFNFFMGPVIVLLGTVVSLKMYDPNYPVWNRLLGTIFLPVISSSFIIGGSLIY